MLDVVFQIPSTCPEGRVLIPGSRTSPTTLSSPHIAPRGIRPITGWTEPRAYRQLGHRTVPQFHENFEEKYPTCARVQSPLPLEAPPNPRYSFQELSSFIANLFIIGDNWFRSKNRLSSNSYQTDAHHCHYWLLLKRNSSPPLPKSQTPGCFRRTIALIDSRTRKLLIYKN